MANIGIKTTLKLNYQPQLVQLPNTQKKSLSVSSFKIVLELTKSEIFGGWCGVAEHNRLGKAQQDERETVFYRPAADNIAGCQGEEQICRLEVLSLLPAGTFVSSFLISFQL